MLLVALLGCVRSILPLYEERLAAVLADPPPLPADWKPQAVLRLGWPTVDDATEAFVAAHGGWGTDLRVGPLKIEPALDVTDARVSAGTCADCVRLDARLDGTLHWSAPVGRGTVPMEARLDVEFGASMVQDAAGVVALRLAPRRVHRATASLGRAAAGLDGAAAQVANWLADSVLSGLPPFEVAKFGDASLPLRAARASSTPEALVVELAMASSGGLATLPVGAVDGFELDVSTASLVELGARAAFDQGPLDYEVVPEPTGLFATGTRFQLDLRLWRIAGKGWWRDVRVDGLAEIHGRRLRLVPERADEVDHSPGAGLADPIALLLQGPMLRAIEDAVDRVLPAAATERVAGVRSSVRVDSLSGAGSTLRVGGTLDFEATRSAEARNRDAHRP